MWIVYHFRGVYVSEFSSKAGAVNYINTMKFPSEYYYEYQENDHAETNTTMPHTGM